MKPATLNFLFISGMNPFAIALRNGFLATLWFALIIPGSIPAASLLGTTSQTVGPTAGSGSVVLNTTNTWNNAANDGWLHLDPAYQTGSNSLIIIFTFDANTSASSRSGSLSIGGGTLAITQAGTNYITTYTGYNAFTNLPQVSSAGVPISVAVDNSGNVFFVDNSNSSIRKRNAVNNTLSTLIATNLSSPQSLAMDGSGNIYIADAGDHTIKLWTATNQSLTTLISAGLNYPASVAVDGDGNLYIADRDNTDVKKWSSADQTLSILVPALNHPTGVAVDNAGNVFIADNSSGVKYWSPISGRSILPNSDLLYPVGVAVDGSGNVYTADWIDNSVKKWSAVDHSLNSMINMDPLDLPECVAADSTGNLFCADLNGKICELPLAFVDSTFKTESTGPGSDTLSPVLPSTVNLSGIFAPTSSDPWLTINSTAGGTVSFSFSAGQNRMTSIQLFDQAIPVLQGITSVPPFALVTDPSGSLILSGTGGPANGSYTCLSSTNLSAPLATWQVVSSAGFAADGSFNFTNTPNASLPANFYTIRIP